MWKFRCPTTGETVRSDVPPSKYVAPERVRQPRSIHNQSPHRPTGISRNGAVLPSHNDHDD